MAYNYSLSGNTCYITVTPVSGYENYWVFARYLEDESSQVYSKWFTTTQNFTTSFPVTPGRSYAINVGYNNTTVSDNVVWMGTQIFTVPDDPSTVHKVYVFDGSDWVLATPYVFDGSDWVLATPYVFDGSDWVPTTTS